MESRPENTDDCWYNLADIIKKNTCACMDVWKEDSVARMYHERSTIPRGIKPWQVDFDCLYEIVKEKTKNDKQASDDVLSIHVRLGDLLAPCLSHTVPDVNKYEKLIKKFATEHGITKCDIYYGNHRGVFQEESQQYIKQLINIIQKLGLQHEFISRSADEDFCSLATSKHYLPSIRGFSWLTATINPNNVAWDLFESLDWEFNVRLKVLVTANNESYIKGMEYQRKLKMANNKS